MKSRILLLGTTGQVGWELNRTLLTLGDLVSLKYPEIDMSQPENIQAVVKDIKPNLIVNATAYTDVDGAEAEPELAMAINGVGPGILAEEAKRINAALIHYSTDYVFDGSKGEPYTEEDQPNPLNVYGNTKLAGERAIQDVGGDYLIFRTSWVYSLRRPCFVTKVLKWAREQETLRIVDDQVSSPTWSRTLAEATSQVLFRCVSGYSKFTLGKQGIYHLSDRGSCSRYEWVKEILNCYPNKSEITVKNIIPAKSHEFPTPAVRPSFSALSCNKIVDEFKFELPHWKEALSLLFP